MGMLSKMKDKLRSEIEEMDMMGAGSNTPNTDLERRFATKIGIDLDDAYAAKGYSDEEVGTSIEQEWEDEYKIKKGGGLQWLTSIAYRSKRQRKIRPSSEDNFVHTTLKTWLAT